MISIHDLCFGYDSVEVLHNINLEIQDGSYAIMVGPNGGGKTTLLKLVLGLLQPRYGSIRVMGTTPVKARKKVSYVPQSLQFDPDFPISVEDVVLMGRLERHLFGPYGREDREQARLALEKVELGDYAGRPFGALSGGERQRVLIAQALASQPRLMLLDEPGANLAPDNRLKLYQLLHALTPGITVLMVSHNLNVVASVASHIICVNGTADCHRIEEVSQDALNKGAWAHLIHEHCPVGDQTASALHTPHNATHSHDA